MNLPPNALCSKAPDLNGVENVWNKVETDLKELGKREGWPKNREELIERLKQILDGINSYFKKLYGYKYGDFPLSFPFSPLSV